MSVADSTALAPSGDIRRPILWGLFVTVVLLGGLVAWSAMTPIGGAIIARGAVIVDGRAKPVQHSEGGTVTSVEVANGDRIAAGQVLLRLDDSVLTATRDIARTRLATALATLARLEAERDGAERVAFAPPDLPEALDGLTLDMDSAEADQAEIFRSNRRVRAGERNVLAERLKQLDEQIAGTDAQLGSLSERLDRVSGQVDRATRLMEQGLTRRRDHDALLDTRATLRGQKETLTARRAELVTAKREAETQVAQGDRAVDRDVATEIGEIKTRIDELILELADHQRRIERLAVRAPAGGVVHEMQVTAEGAVVDAGDTLLEIVPRDRPPRFEVRVDPSAIEQVHTGQRADIVVAALDPRSTPRIEGTVETVSARSVDDQRTGQSFYRVDITVPAAERARLGRTLVPGMPVEAYIATKDRTVLSYLADPLTTHLRRAFRD